MRTRVVIFAALFAGAGCAPLYFPHPMLHPSRGTRHHAGGAALGLLPHLDEDTNARTDAVAFYGEGWARVALGPGQLEWRLTPALGFVSYRLGLLDGPELPVSVSVVPSFGAGFHFISGFGGWTQSSTVALVPNVTGILSVLDDSLYVAPRFGFAYIENPLSAVNGQDTAMFAFGLNLGYVIPLASKGLPLDLSAELGWQRVAYTGAALGSYHVLAFSVGFSFATPPDADEPARPPPPAADPIHDELEQDAPALTPLP